MQVSFTEPETAALKPRIELYGTSTCSDCLRAKRWLDERAMPYLFHDIIAEAGLVDRVIQLNTQLGIARLSQIPVLTLDGIALLSEPTDEQLAEALAAGRIAP